MNLKTFHLLVFLVAVTIFNTALSEKNQRLPNYTFLLDAYDGYMTFEDPVRGEANAKVLLDNEGLVIQFVTPAYNLHGIEAAPSQRTAEEKARVNDARNKFLRAPEDYIKFTPSESCQLDSLIYTLKLVDEGQQQSKLQVSNWHHYDVKAELYYSCDDVLPETLNLRIFDGYPRIKKVKTQFIAHNSDLRRADLTPEKSVIQFTRTSGEKLDK